MSYDPSRTTTLRRLFENAVKSRLNLFWQRLRDLLLVEDAFGIQEKRDEQRFSLSFNQRFFHPSNQFNDLLTANVRWRFLTESAQLEVFKRWLAEEIFQNVFDGLEDSAEDAYWYEFARKGFEKGQKRAFDQSMNRTWGSRAFKEGARAEFLRSSFYNPVSIDRVKVLASRNLTQLKNVTETMAKDILRELTDGLVQGKNPREIASRLMQTVGLSKWRSTVIARTEIIRAHGEGQLDTLEKLGMKTVSIAVEWSTAGDGRVCELCQPMQGVVLTIEEARGLIPRHPQCVTADTLIHAPDLRTVMSAKYSGSVFEVVTGSGRSVTFTSHHILLTQRGWVFAKDITDSDYLVDAGFLDSLSLSPDNNLAQTSIGEVFGSLVKSCDPRFLVNTLSMPEYLHGDGKFINSEIQIVDVDGILRDQHETGISCLPEIKKSLLMVGRLSTLQSESLNISCPLTFSRQRMARTTDSFMSFLGIEDVLLARSLTHHDLIRLRLFSRGESHPYESSANNTSSNVVSLGETIDALPIEKRFSNLIEGRLRKVDSVKVRHVVDLSVYDVSTESTMYAANGFFTSNCRCSYIPANLGETERTRVVAGVTIKVPQKKTKAAVDAALRESVKAEIPKSSKRSVETQRKQSKWVGAGLDVSAARPKNVFGVKSK